MADSLKRILDKGIVHDVLARVGIAVVDLGIRWEARRVASIDSHLERWGQGRQRKPTNLTQDVPDSEVMTSRGRRQKQRAGSMEVNAGLRY